MLKVIKSNTIKTPRFLGLAALSGLRQSLATDYANVRLEGLQKLCRFHGASFIRRMSDIEWSLFCSCNRRIDMSISLPSIS